MGCPLGAQGLPPDDASGYDDGNYEKHLDGMPLERDAVPPCWRVTSAHVENLGKRKMRNYLFFAPTQRHIGFRRGQSRRPSRFNAKAKAEPTSSDANSCVSTSL